MIYFLNLVKVIVTIEVKHVAMATDAVEEAVTPIMNDSRYTLVKAYYSLVVVLVSWSG